MPSVEDAVLSEFTAGFNADALSDYGYDHARLRDRAEDTASNLVELLGPAAADAASLLRAMLQDRQHPLFRRLRNDTLFGWNSSDEDYAIFQTVATAVVDGIDQELSEEADR